MVANNSDMLLMNHIAVVLFPFPIGWRGYKIIVFHSRNASPVLCWHPNLFHDYMIDEFIDGCSFICCHHGDSRMQI